MNWSTFWDQLKAAIMPVALGTIALSQNPATAALLPHWAVPLATGLATLSHAAQTITDKQDWNK